MSSSSTNPTGIMQGSNPWRNVGSLATKPVLSQGFFSDAEGSSKYSGIKITICQMLEEPFYKVNCPLAQVDRLGSMGMYAACTVMTLHRWV